MTARTLARVPSETRVHGCTQCAATLLEGDVPPALRIKIKLGVAKVEEVNDMCIFAIAHGKVMRLDVADDNTSFVHMLNPGEL